MATHPAPRQHLWFTPADCAAMLDAKKHGDHWRVACPVHKGDNPQSLSIREGRDKYGNPCTLLHCFAQDCTIEEICEAIGIPVRNLFCIRPDYAKATRNAPRAHSPRIECLKHLEEPSADDIAQILLEEMLVSDPEWIQTCAPAREKMWELAQTSPKAREMFTRAVKQAGLHAMHFWDSLASEMEN